jgi:hypothetical protein
MENEIKSGKKISIRNAGKDESWLQELIFNKPSVLGLGELIPLTREKKQSSGGRLDILLKDPEDGSMYEVEIMLGETDPSHIIRTIEYWDIEKRRYPQHQHFPVLIAESFNKRYFNVIQILSINIPMIAIQADLIEVGEQRIINFTKILDIYEEIAEESETIIVNETTWVNRAKWTLQTAKDLLALINSNGRNLKLNFTQSYVAIVSNKGNAYWLYKKSEPKSDLGFRENDEAKVEAIKKICDDYSIPFRYNKYKEFYIGVDKEFIKKHKEIILKIHDTRFPKEANNSEENTI